MLISCLLRSTKKTSVSRSSTPRRPRCRDGNHLRQPMGASERSRQQKMEPIPQSSVLPISPQRLGEHLTPDGRKLFGRQYPGSIAVDRRVARAALPALREQFEECRAPRRCCVLAQVRPTAVRPTLALALKKTVATLRSEAQPRRCPF